MRWFPRLWKIKALTLGNIIAAARRGNGEHLIRYRLPRFLIPNSVRRRAGAALNEALLEGCASGAAGGGRGGGERFAPEPFEEMALMLIMRGLSRADALATPIAHYRAAIGMGDALDKNLAAYVALARHNKLGNVVIPSIPRRRRAKAAEIDPQTAFALGESVIDSFPLAAAKPEGNA